MLTPELPKKQQELAVIPQQLEIVLADDSGESLSLILPPFDDLQEIESLKEGQLSVHESVHESEVAVEMDFRDALNRLKEKLPKFNKSSTFLNRVANVAAAAGDREEEAHYLALANQVDTDVFFAHRIGDNLVARNLGKQAIEHFEALDLENDEYANLRLAYFHVHRNDLARARVCVARAVKIDPLSFSARLFEGGLRLADRDFAGAIQSFRIAAEERPTSSVLFGNMAVAYIGLRHVEKALASLRQSIALDALNETAIVLLADLTNHLRIDRESIPSLQRFLMFEQKKAGVWARLARALLRVGKPQEAIVALKSQAALGASSAIWNNLGVAYIRGNDRTKASQAFKHAMQIGVQGFDFLVAARNLAQMMVGRVPNHELIQFTRSVIESDSERLSRRDSRLSDIYVFYLHALFGQENAELTFSACESILDAPQVAEPLLVWVLTTLMGRYSLYKETREKALALIESHRLLIESLGARTMAARTMLFNNVAFAYAEAGRISESERYINWISSTIHREPYPTATLALIHFKKGHIERGTQLYEEATRLATNQTDRVRIRQKLNLEMGRHLINVDPVKSQIYLSRVLKARDGEKALIDNASQELLKLPSK